MTYVYPRKGSYQFRYPIPEDVRSYFPKGDGSKFHSHFVGSLHTGDRDEANRRALVKFAEFERRFSMLRDGIESPHFAPFFRSVFDFVLERGRRRRATSILSVEQLDFELKTLRQALEYPQPGELKAVAGWVVDEYFASETDGTSAKIPDDTALSNALLSAAAGVLLDVYTQLSAEAKGMSVAPQPRSAVLKVVSESNPAIGEAIAIAPEGRLTLAKFWVLYAAEKQKSGSPVKPRTLKRRETAWRELAEFLGAETPLFKVRKSDIYGYRAELQKTPSYGGSLKRLRDLDIKQRVALSEANPGEFSLLDNGTIDDRIRQINAVFQLAVDRDFIDRNPVKGVPQMSVSSEPARDIYTLEELQVIFSSAPYFAEPVPLDKQTDDFWVPLLELFMGTRANENYLRITDVVVDDAIPHFDIVPFEGRPLKNKSSKRRLPIHPQLIELGFLDYCQLVRASGESVLFPTWRFRDGGTASESPARRRFNKHLKRILPERMSRTDSHTFRHNFETALSGVEGVSERVMLRLSGRTVGGTAAGYIKDKGLLPQLAEAIGKVRYDGLTLDHLRSG